MTEFNQIKKRMGSGLSFEVAIVLAYLLSWVGGLIILLIEKENRLVRFHAMQSILLGAAVTVLLILLSIIGVVPLVGWLFSALLKPIVSLVYLVFIIVLMVAALNDRKARVPVLADWVDEFLNENLS